MLDLGRQEVLLQLEVCQTSSILASLSLALCFYGRQLSRDAQLQC